MLNTITEFISDFLSFLLELEIINVILSLISGLILLLIASKIAEKKVNQYQQAKDASMMRESMLKLYSDLLKIYFRTEALFEVWRKTVDSKKNATDDIQMEIRKDLGEFHAILTHLIGTVKIRLELNKERKTVMKKFSEAFVKYNELIYDSFEKYEQGLIEDLPEISAKFNDDNLTDFSKNLAEILTIILSGEVKFHN